MADRENGHFKITIGHFDSTIKGTGYYFVMFFVINKLCDFLNKCISLCSFQICVKMLIGVIYFFFQSRDMFSGARDQSATQVQQGSSSASQET